MVSPGSGSLGEVTTISVLLLPTTMIFFMFIKGTVSNLINGTKGAGQDSLTAVAHALRLPPELVFEKAGILPPKTEPSSIKRKLVHLAEDLPDSDVELVIAMLEQRQEYYRKNPSAKPSK